MAIKLLQNPDERNDPPRPLLEHLLALRDMLVFAAVAWAVCVVIAAVFSPHMLQGLDLTSGFTTAMSIALWGGTALAFPFLVYSILRFVFPALTNREKIILMSILVFGTGLFLVGVGLA